MPLAPTCKGRFFTSNVLPMRTSTFALALLLLCCGKPDYIGIRPNEQREITRISDAISTRGIGRVLRIRGTVGSVCQDEGCWVTITDGSAEIKLRFADPSLGVPLNLTGEVVAEGVVRERVEKGARVPEMTATGVVFVKTP